MAYATMDSCKFSKDEIPTSRPNEGEGPTKITATIYVFDLVDVVTVKQEFTLDFFLQAEWKDERLGELVRKSGREVCQIPIENIWRAKTFILNSRDVKNQMVEVAHVYANGDVKAEQRIIATLAARFNLEDFPLDSQVLPVTFISSVYSPEEVEIVFEGGGADAEISETSWLVKDRRGKTGSYSMRKLQEGKGEMAKLVRFDYELEVKRDPSFYIWKVFLPICLIVFVSWGVFWVDPKQLPTQSGISTAMMLTIIAFLFSLQNVIPKIMYLTRLDIFVYSSLFFVFLAFVEALTTCTLAAYGNEVKAKRIDKVARIVFPTAYLGVLIWFWAV